MGYEKNEKKSEKKRFLSDKKRWRVRLKNDGGKKVNTGKRVNTRLNGISHTFYFSTRRETRKNEKKVKKKITWNRRKIVRKIECLRKFREKNEKRKEEYKLIE